MNINETLTKENFWNEIMEKFPKATKVFCEWIDEYKKQIEWDKLFSSNDGNTIPLCPIKSPIKFHHIPYAMQQGIWIEFASYILNDFFEQPEYSYSGDLAEDIKIVFSEIEEFAD